MKTEIKILTLVLSVLALFTMVMDDYELTTYLLWVITSMQLYSLKDLINE